MADSLDITLWEKCKTALQAQLGSVDAIAWLPGLELLQVSESKVVLGGLPNIFIKKHLIRHFQPLLREVISQNFAPATDFVLELRVGPPTETRIASAPLESKRVVPVTEPPGFAAGQTLESFQYGSANRPVWELASAVATAPGGTFNPFLILGAVGMGKTHLLHGIADAIQKRSPDSQVLYRTAEEFTNDVLEGIQKRKMEAVRIRYRDADAFLLDDLSFIGVSVKAQEELLHTFDALLRGGRQIVLASKRLPKAIKKLNPDLRSRLESGLIAEVFPPEKAVRLAIAREKSRRDGIAIDEACLELLAARIGENPRRLEGAMVRVGAYSSLLNVPITPEFVGEYAAPFFDPDPVASPFVESRRILEEVAREYGFTLRRLRSRERSAQLNQARRIAMVLLREMSRMSFPEIGTLLGNRSHSTIVHGVQSMAKAMAAAPEIEYRLNRIRESVID